jgi:tetratricopeptide (TPR) repeat protein
LLHKRYDSDLDRLDFIAEGSYFLNGLQETRCPLCDQPMGEGHRHWYEGHSLETVYASSQAEATKILGLRNELVETISTLKARRAEREEQQQRAKDELDRIAARIDRELVPALQATKLNDRAVALEPGDAFVLAWASLIFAFTMGDIERGSDFSDRALAINPNLSNAWNARGWISACIGEPERSLECFDRAISITVVVF